MSFPELLRKIVFFKKIVKSRVLVNSCFFSKPCMFPILLLSFTFPKKITYM